MEILEKMLMILQITPVTEMSYWILSCLLAQYMNDAEGPYALVNAARSIASEQGEIVLTMTAGDHASLTMTRSMLKQLNRLDMDSHTLLITDIAENCEKLLSTRAKCMWSSRVLERAPAQSTSLSKFWDHSHLIERNNSYQMGFCTTKRHPSLYEFGAFA